MVKKWIMMLTIAFLLIIGCVFESRFVNGSFNWLINSLETLQIELAESKDNISIDKLMIESYNLHNDWHKKVGLLKCLIWHTNIKDIETGLARISVYIEENDYTEAYAEIASLIDFVAHYLDDFRISPENVL